MKKTFSFFLVATGIACFFTGCKKTDFPSYETNIQFTYNGQAYSRTSPSRILNDVIIVQNEFLLVNFTGLIIEDPALFGGRIPILTRNPGPIQCAFLQPTGGDVSPGTNCQLTSGGNPIDSVAVYWYESGSLSFTYTDCKQVTAAIVPGQKDCAISGQFDLTLTNKNNQKIRLTNGSFSGRIRTYP